MKLMVFQAQRWCGPCRLMKPIVAVLKEELPDLEVADIDADDESVSEEFENFGVMSIPFFVLLDDDHNVVRTAKGMQTLAELKQFVTKENA